MKMILVFVLLTLFSFSLSARGNNEETDTPEIIETDTPEITETDTLEIIETDTPEITETDTLEIIETDTLEIIETDSLGIIETDSPGITETDSPGITETDSPGITETDIETPEVPQTLFEKTLDIDISSADFYELTAWCRYLGLDEKGTKKDIQNSIYEHYKKNPPEEEGEGEDGKGNILMIESAERTEYLSIEKIDENYIMVSGNVIVRMEDKAEGTTHIIKTDKIILNQSENLITAEGNVSYSRVTDSGEEVFTGEKLSFDVTVWEGIFIEGTSEKKKTIDENELTFFYSGERIYRSDSDIIILDKGKITSSSSENPYYSLKAKKIWVLAPGEWGVKSAVLYIGHVPIFYFPFFFKPGDKLIFNPAMGMKEPAGFFLQTSTYLLGQSKGEDDTLSFLSLTEDDALYETELEGLYLRKTTKKASTKDDGSDEDFIKIMFDIYSRLGVFAGVQGKIKESDFYVGLAFSRNVYHNNYGSYSPLYDSGDGAESSWNKSYFLNFELPFRYGTEIDLEDSIHDFSYTLSLDLYSDPYFLRDFDDRSETIDWGKLLGLEDAEDLDDEDTNISIMDRLWWYFHASYNFNQKLLGGVISSINVTRFDIAANWKNKKQADIGFEGTDPSLPGYIPPSKRTDYFSPGQYFYYPEYYKLPDVSFAIKGEIFSKSYEVAPSRQTYEKTGDPGKSDLYFSEKNQKINTTDITDINQENISEDFSDSGIIESEHIGDETVHSYMKRNFFDHSLSYTISPSLSLTETMNYSEWEKPEDISFEKAYSETRTYGTGSVLYEAGFLNNFITLKNNIVVTGDYRNHYNKSDSITDSIWDSYKLQDYKTSYIKVENKASLTSYPMYKYEIYDQTTIKYTLNTVLFKKEFQEVNLGGDPVYDNEWIKFDEDFFKDHEAEVNFKYLSPWDQIQQIRVKYVAPPLLQEVENENILRTGLFTSTFTFKLYEEEEKGNWTPGNFTFKERFAWDDRTYLEQIVIYDGYHNELKSSETIGRISFIADEIYFKQNFLFGFPELSPLEAVSVLNLWFFQTEFKAEWKQPMKYDIAYGWTSEDDEKFVPSEFSAKLDFSKFFMPFWKNRIRYKTNMLLDWTMDLQEFTENTLAFELGFDFEIYKFLKINFNARSENNNTYRYFPSLAEKMGEKAVNPFMDLIKSFNFFDIDDRYESFFKLKSLSFSIVHHLGDWDISITYEGIPKLNTPDSGMPEWKWESETSILVKWNPIKEIKTKIDIDSDGISF